MRFTRYLVTGASGFLGRAVVDALQKKGVEIVALALPNDPLASLLPRGVRVITGNMLDPASLMSFFSDTDKQTCVIHCAGIVSVSSRPDLKLVQANVIGTDNVIWWCRHRPVGRLIDVSSVHAFSEVPGQLEVTEATLLVPELVRGAYGQSKAVAAAHVYDAARLGLDACVVFPSGLIGPGDAGRGSMTAMLLAFLSGHLPLAVRGGYDFVDVRDVAAGIAACAENGQKGAGYILSGEYTPLRDLLSAAGEAARIRSRTLFIPARAALAAASVYERLCARKKQPPFFTAEAVRTLSSGVRFSHKVATHAFGYKPRRVRDSVRDTVQWLLSQKAVFP